MSELRTLAARFPHKIQLGLVGVAWLALFHWLGNSTFGYVATPSLFRWVYPLYDANPDDGIGLLAPLVTLWLIYHHRDRLNRITPEPWAPALALVAVGLILHLVGYRVQQGRISLAGCIVGFFGLTGMLWGREWMRQTRYPFALLAFCIPVSVYLAPFTFHLRVFVARVASSFCIDVLQMHLLRRGTEVFSMTASGLPRFQFEVAAACSGIRSLTAVMLLTLVYGYLFFESPTRRLVLFIAAPLLAVVGNIIRLITVFVVGEALGQKAGATIETGFGFVTFCGVTVGGVLLLGRFLRERAPEPVSQPATLPE